MVNKDFHNHIDSRHNFALLAVIESDPIRRALWAPGGFAHQRSKITFK